ncbi:hypothetical protein [Bacillus suaedae]|uniref:Uncharacterized protein n=1 Tax=Halalkalibacter suaedae TaxID=2822140 RepID=A0A941AN16_9BACI|nr:hypothetical protein [Bacillus suaedae]MBP3950411.1 hypothetical protein [Bacillus suaedae]
MNEFYTILGEQQWIALIGLVFAGFLIISVLKTTVKVVFISFVILIAANLFFDLSITELIDSSAESISEGQELLEHPLVKKVGEIDFLEWFQNRLSELDLDDFENGPKVDEKIIE